MDNNTQLLALYKQLKDEIFQTDTRNIQLSVAVCTTTAAILAIALTKKPPCYIFRTKSSLRSYKVPRVWGTKRSVLTTKEYLGALSWEKRSNP